MGMRSGAYIVGREGIKLVFGTSYPCGKCGVMLEVCA